MKRKYEVKLTRTIQETFTTVVELDDGAEPATEEYEAGEPIIDVFDESCAYALLEPSYADAWEPVHFSEDLEEHVATKLDVNDTRKPRYRVFWNGRDVDAERIS